MVPVSPEELPKTYYIFETDADGNKIDTTGFSYTMQDGKEVSFTSMEDLTRDVTLVNTLKEPEEEVTPTPTPSATPTPTPAPGSGNPGGSTPRGGSTPSYGAKTGDNSHLELYLVLLAAALAAGIGGIVYKKKRRK